MTTTLASGDPLTILLQRIDLFWTRYEGTGDERYMRLALDADRMYRRAKADA